MSMQRLLTPTILAALVLMLPNPAVSSIIFVANMTGAQEGTPNASTATGFATFELNDAMTQFSFNGTVFGLDFTGSQTPGTNLDNLTAAHIHAPAPPGINASVVFGFIGTPFNDNNPNNAVVTPFANGVGGAFSSVWDLPEGQGGLGLAARLPAILDGLAYINFHTVQFPGGEIRGQILRIPEPGTLFLLGLGFGAVAMRRRRFAS